MNSDIYYYIWSKLRKRPIFAGIFSTTSPLIFYCTAVGTNEIWSVVDRAVRRKRNKITWLYRQVWCYIMYVMQLFSTILTFLLLSILQEQNLEENIFVLRQNNKLLGKKMQIKKKLDNKMTKLLMKLYCDVWFNAQSTVKNHHLIGALSFCIFPISWCYITIVQLVNWTFFNSFTWGGKLFVPWLF